MKKVIRSSPFRLRKYIVLPAVGTMLLLAVGAPGYSPQMRRAMLMGPWEIVVQSHADRAPIRFPVEVADVDKTADLDKVLPVPGSVVKIRLSRYLPDLQWIVSGVDDPSGGIIALINAKGPGLDQEMWLDAADAKKRAITSSAGGIKLLQVYDPNKLEQTVKQLAESKSVGIVSVWPKKTKKPLQFVVKKGQSVSIPESGYVLKVLDYMPHYSVDTATKKVTNASKKPINPAIRLRFSKDKSSVEEWLWSKFPSSPHSKGKLPFRAEFTEFDLGQGAGCYVLAGAANSEPWIMFLKDGKVVAEKAETAKGYPLSDSKYVVAIKEYYGSGIIKQEWKNGDESLAHPAIVATVQKGQKKKELVLELNKPSHYDSEDGDTMTFLFGRKADPGMKGRGMGGHVK